MLCEKCNKRVATIHLIKLINGEKSEVRLCESCAKEISDISLVGSLGSIDEISIPNILGGFFESIDKNKQNKIEVICKKCGLTYSQFKASGQLGCAECYQSFSSYLRPMFKRIQGDLEHIGKVPKRSGIKLVEKKKYVNLKKELQKAILEEEYERAAVLRDKIKDIENSRTEVGKDEKLDL